MSESNKRFNERRAIAIVAIVDTREIDRELFVVARFLTCSYVRFRVNEPENFSQRKKESEESTRENINSQSNHLVNV